MARERLNNMANEQSPDGDTTTTTEGDAGEREPGITGNSRERRDKLRMLALIESEGLDYETAKALVARQRNEAAQKAKDAEERARKAQDIERIEELHRQQLADVARERDEMRAVLERHERTTRTDRLLDSLAAKTGVTSRPRLRGLLEVAAADRGIDIAPHKLDEGTLAMVSKVLKELDPDSFQPPTRAAKSGPAGERTSDDRKDQVVGMMRKYGSRPAG